MEREPVTEARIQMFLRELGRRFHGRGRLYLVGGTQMILTGLRVQTEDIDYLAQIPGDQQEFISVLRSLIRHLDISVEPAHPGDFIPLPSGWEDRSRFVGRFGGLDVFSFDPLSTALAKIERGSNRDLHDVLALVQHGDVRIADLEAAFEEILPRLERESLRVDELDFRRKFEAFVRIANRQEHRSGEKPGGTHPNG